MAAKILGLASRLSLVEVELEQMVGWLLKTGVNPPHTK